MLEFNRVHNMDCLEGMKKLSDNLIDAIITDPPYGLNLMGKTWDHGIPGPAYWSEALRVAKPGANLLAFGGTRTYHRLTCAIEDAGWQIKDCLMWLYGSGFPKNHYLLKPAWEPIILAKKDGLGFLGVEECRIGANLGRWPANILLDEESAIILDHQSGVLSSHDTNDNGKYLNKPHTDGVFPLKYMAKTPPGRADTGGASRFFYTSKASSSERNKGTDGNNHPTVKPLDLMEYLCKLVTPLGGLILDPFAGSGTTIKAAMNKNFLAIGFEIDSAYTKIANDRLYMKCKPLTEFKKIKIEG